MTVYVTGDPVTVVGGDLDEGWLAVEFEDREGVRDVNASAVAANGGGDELLRILNEVGDFRGKPLHQFLPLRVNYPRYSVSVLTNGNRVLWEVNHRPDLYEDTHEMAEQIERTVLNLVRAWKEPKRFIFEHRDALPDDWGTGQ